MLQTDEPLFFPTDLPLMLQFLNKRHQMQQIKSGIISDKTSGFDTMSVAEISNSIRAEMNRFI